MPKFTDVVSAPDTRGIQYSPDKTAATAISGAGTLIGGALDLRDEQIKSDFTSQLASGIDQAAAVQSEEKQLAEDLLSTNDKNTIDELQKKYQLLERGVATGKISAGSADIRKKSLIREYSNRHPWLASDFRSIAASYPTISGGAETKDPRVKYLEDLTFQAEKAGVPLSRARELSMLAARNKMQADALAATNQLAGERGNASVEEFQSLTSNIITEHTQTTLANLFAMIQTDPESFKGDTGKLIVQQSKNATLDLLVQKRAEAKAAGITYTDPQWNAIVKDLEDSYAPIAAFSDAEDGLEYIKRQQKFLQHHTNEDLMKNYPVIAKWQAIFGKDATSKFVLETMPTLIAGFQGDMSKIKVLAENGDPSAQQLLAFGNAGIVQEFYRAMQNGGGQSTQNKYLDSLIKSMSTKAIEDPSQPTEIKDAALTNIISADDTGEYSRLLSPAAIQETLKHPKKVKELSNRINYDEPDIINELKKELTSPVKRPSARGGKVTGKVELTDTIEFANGQFYKKSEGERKLSGIGTSRRRSQQTHLPNNPLDYINMIYRLRKSYNLFDDSDPRGEKWIKGVLDQINGEKPAEEKVSPEVSQASAEPTKLDPGLYDYNGKLIRINEDGSMEEVA